MKSSRIGFMFLIAVSFFLVGCSSSSQLVDEVNTSTVDKNQWGYQAMYNQNLTLLSQLDGGILVKDDIYVWSVPVESGDVSSRNLYKFNTKDNTLTLVNNDPSNSCSSNNLNKCSGNIPFEISDLDYYNNKFYYVLSEIDTTTESMNYEIHQMDLDGTNRKKVFEYKGVTANQSPFILQFHNGYLFVINENKILKVNIEDWNYEIILKQDKGSYGKIFFDGDVMFVAVTDYQNKNELIHSGTIVFDMNKNKITSIIPTFGGIAYQSKDSFIEHTETDLVWHNMDNTKTSIINNAPGFVLGNEKYFLVSESNLFSDHPKYVLTDKNGDVLDEMNAANNDNLAMVLVGDAFYYRKIIYDEVETQKEVRYELYKVDIKDNKFKTPVLVAEY